MKTTLLKHAATAIPLLWIQCLFSAEPASNSRGPLPSEWFNPPEAYANQLGPYHSPLFFYGGGRATKSTWPKRREEILTVWHGIMGPWPPLLVKPEIEIISERIRDNLIERKVRLPISTDLQAECYLLQPKAKGPFPAVIVVYYDPETSIGLGQQELRDFGYQLARRGFVTLSIGSPGGDARKPDAGATKCQPLSFLAYVAANCHTALARRPEVDSKRIGIAGHSYGGKWAMFASCLYDKFACAAWSDPGIVFDEAKPNVNYWEPWYLGKDATASRKPGLVTGENGRTGAYKTLFESGHDLQELHALMAPRPFLVSGGSEDGRERWVALNHSRAVNQLLGKKIAWP